MIDDRSLISMLYGLRAKCKNRYRMAQRLGQYELAFNYYQVVESLSVLIDYLEV